jgi:hypothetical protein
MLTPWHRPQALFAALRGWILAAIFLLVALTGVVLLMLAPELDPNPLAFMSPG